MFRKGLASCCFLHVHSGLHVGLPGDCSAFLASGSKPTVCTYGSEPTLWYRWYRQKNSLKLARCHNYVGFLLLTNCSLWCSVQDVCFL